MFPVRFRVVQDATGDLKMMCISQRDRVQRLVIEGHNVRFGIGHQNGRMRSDDELSVAITREVVHQREKRQLAMR